MSSSIDIQIREISGRDELVAAWPADASRPGMTGMEHEKWGFREDEDGAPVPYADPLTGKPGMRELLCDLAVTGGWTPGFEKGNIVSLARDGATLTLEPACQAEHGGRPHASVHDIAQETETLVAELARAGHARGIGFAALGLHPLLGPDELPDVPKSRYPVLAALARRHNSPEGLVMMKATAGVQSNVSAHSERDAVKKLRVLLNVQNVMTALCANSPFSGGRLAPYQSLRSHNNNGAIGGRYGGMFEVAFEDGFGYERFTDYMLREIPMLGIYRDGKFMDAAGGNFSGFMEGRVKALEGERATFTDWATHLSTWYPEVRMRLVIAPGGESSVVLENRGPDAGPQDMIAAQAALVAGLAHDPDALEEAARKTRDWTRDERRALRDGVPRHGLATPFRRATVRELAGEMLDIAERGLARRNILDAQGRDEGVYLRPFRHIVESGETWAGRLARRFRGAWRGEIAHVFNEMNYARNPSITRPAPRITRRVVSAPRKPPPLPQGGRGPG